MILTEKNGSTPKRIRPNATLFTINPTFTLSTWDCQVSEHGDYNHLGYDTKKLLPWIMCMKITY